MLPVVLIGKVLAVQLLYNLLSWWVDELVGW